MLRFRSGLNIICRAGTREWDVIHELMFAGGYGRAVAHLRRLPGQPLVLDLGGNIGLFSLLAAASHPRAEIHAYEPGPPNYRLFEMNQLANSPLGDRIHLHKEAVGGESRTVEWCFNDLNPGGSGLFETDGASRFSVHVRSLSEVVDSLPAALDLVKIDIEGAEYELLDRTPPEVWQRIHTISLELHDDPQGKIPRGEFLRRATGFGYRVEEESVCSYFLSR
jgi:FkbM family methyltransferase